MAGIKTFAVMQTMLKLNLGQRTDAEDVSHLGTWINDAYADLSSRLEFVPGLYYVFPELDSSYQISTVDGTTMVTRPISNEGSTTDILIYSVYNTTKDRKLDYRPYGWYLQQSTTAESEPRYWTPYGNYLYLSPTPDAAYVLTIKYRKRVALLTGITVTEIAPEWDEVIIQMATIKGMIHLRDYEKIKGIKEELQEMIASRIRMSDAMNRDRLHQYYRPDYIYTNRGGGYG